MRLELTWLPSVLVQENIPVLDVAAPHRIEVLAGDVLCLREVVDPKADDALRADAWHSGVVESDTALRPATSLQHLQEVAEWSHLPTLGDLSGLGVDEAVGEEVGEVWREARVAARGLGANGVEVDEPGLE